MKKLLLLSVLLTVFSSCSHHRTETQNSTKISDINFQDDNYQYYKKCGSYFFGIGPTDDPTLASLVQENRLKRVAIVEHSYHFYLVYSKSCITAYATK